MGLQEDETSSSSSESCKLSNGDGEEGWEDVKPDVEEIAITSLFDEQEFPDVQSMLQHCMVKYDFNFLKVKDEFELDFLGTIKLVNYIRFEVKSGNRKPDLSTKLLFEDERFLRPTLEDDALLYSLDDLNDNHATTQDHISNRDATVQAGQAPDLLARITELEAELRLNQQQFADYRKAVNEVLEGRWNSSEAPKHLESATPPTDETMATRQDDDAHYFQSYSNIDIHEIMLQDQVRTNAYRDFVYQNKHIFQDKVVLDVGCGTGILSMFCARAGAKKVIAVDNSDIINMAREIVFKNDLDQIITCVHGKIEEVTLPVGRVDVIISEWMGYCLLYEAMLDSVLWARDHYLVPGGLLVPSHATLRIAPVTDMDFIADRYLFWKDVYGFDMRAMTTNLYDNVVIRDTNRSHLSADSQPFLHLPLLHISKEDLTFSDNPFAFVLNEDVDSLEGFVIWFDIFFLPSSNDIPPRHARADHWTEKGAVGTAFTTGPDGEQTHWHQGCLLINYGDDYRKGEPHALKKGTVISGGISYQKRAVNARELEIELKWSIDGVNKEYKQVWLMR